MAATPGKPSRKKPAKQSDAAPPEEVSLEPVPASEADPAPVLRRKELFERVVASSGAKKKDVKPIAEAMLAVLGAALARGEELNLPPLGKLRVVRKAETGLGEAYTLKLRRPAASTEEESVTPPLAEPGE